MKGKAAKEAVHRRLPHSLSYLRAFGLFGFCLLLWYILPHFPSQVGSSRACLFLSVLKVCSTVRSCLHVCMKAVALAASYIFNSLHFPGVSH